MLSLNGKILTTLSACGAAMLLGGQSAFAQSYTIKDLGVLPNTRISIPHSINQNGLVVGESDQEGGFALKAFLYKNNTLIDLGPAGSTGAVANSINTTGQIVGLLATATGGQYPTLWQNGSPIALNYSGNALAINYAGAIAGIYQDAALVDHASLWTPTTPNGATGTVRAITASDGAAYAVNHFSQVGGRFRVGNADHAFLWDSTHGLKDFGDIGGFGYAASLGVNYGGIVVGRFVGPSGGVSTDYHAFVWKPSTANGQTGTMQDLGLGQAFSINNSGQFVGISANTAVLWQNGVKKNLNAAIPAGSGWTLSEADTINDGGQIAGTGSLNGSMDHAFLLTPIH